ncbi:transcriptional regulator [Vibrio sp. SCSIO 43169]|uniref:transcriptional regulator n=1 Tax=Vibrio sp. SCSIO 43169 TaxID=2822801 RepID=UPI0020440F73|nr:transcriptional regulator [Vibrio sp. SCSIO 43169]MCM5507150.1 transcriptional regulator [Vibrio sp. SCSIO 43169]
MKFEERLAFLIKDRKKTPWGKSLGFTSPSITAMFNGHTPGPEFLNAIRRAENVNLNWLLTSEGSPYIVEYFQTADALSDYVCAMLHDEPWVVYVCSHIDTACLVLTQPGAYEFKGKFVDYNMIHVLVGPGDDVLANVLNDHNSDGGAVFVPLMTDKERKDLMAGKVGTYELLGGLEPLLNPHKVGSHISDIEFTGANSGESSVNLPIMRTVIRLVGEKEAELHADLTTEQKARIIAAVYKQLSRVELPGPIPEQAFSAAVEAAFDVLID